MVRYPRCFMVAYCVENTAWITANGCEIAISSPLDWKPKEMPFNLYPVLFHEDNKIA